MTDYPVWHPGEEGAEFANAWQNETDLCKALEMASADHYYAGYSGYDKLMLAAKAEIERLRAALSRTP